MADLVYIRKKAVAETDDRPGMPSGHAVGVDPETAKSILLDPSLEKCKQGDGWAKAPSKSEK